MPGEGRYVEMGAGERGAGENDFPTKSATQEARRKILGLGFWVQGFRTFPWMAVNFYLKDGLKVSPSRLQVLHNFSNIPVVGKPLYGFLSDFVCVRGEYRLPYIAMGGIFSNYATNFLITKILGIIYTIIRIY